MCWCLHFSPLTGSICYGTIDTLLDTGRGARTPRYFLHIWQRLALLPGESRPTGDGGPPPPLDWKVVVRHWRVKRCLLTADSLLEAVMSGLLLK